MPPPNQRVPLLAAALTLALLVAAGCTTAAGLPFPRRADEACAGPAVTHAFAACLGGPTPACCAGLDAVFADGPAKGCLCLPQVLYTAATQASQRGLDVLGLLHGCRRLSAGPQHARPFATQWASAVPNSCPIVPLGASTAELGMLLGSESVLPGPHGDGSSRPAWAWSNMLQLGELMAQPRFVHALAEHAAGLAVVQYLLLVFMATPPLFLIAHFGVLRPLSGAYRRLAQQQRIVCCQHLVYAAVFSASLVPQTLLAVRALFGALTGDFIAGRQLPLLIGVFIGSRCVLYVVEACVRSVVLDLFACHEAPLYVALLAYRLCARRRLARALLAGSSAYYVLARVAQTVVLAGMIYGFAHMPHVATTPAFVIVALLCGAFTFIQAYTVVIYAVMFRRAGAPPMPAGRGELPPRSACAGGASASSRAGGNSVGCSADAPAGFAPLRGSKGRAAPALDGKDTARGGTDQVVVYMPQ